MTPPPNGSALLRASLQTSPDGQYTLQIELALAAGVTVLIGPSGSGKSTALDLLAGHRLPSEGLITLFDETLLRKPPGQPPSLLMPPELRRIGYVMQQPMLFPHLSVRSNLAYGIGRLSSSVREERISKLAHQLQIESLLDRRPTELSGGQRQRVALGRALAPRPKALLLDEPLSAVDLGQRHELLERLRGLLVDLGIPVLYVTHSSEEQRFWSAPTLLLQPSRANPSVVEVTEVLR